MLRIFTSLTILTISFFMLSASTGEVHSQASELPPLTELGPYGVGLKIINYVDEQREDWQLETYVWFPADPEQGRRLSVNSPLIMDAVADHIDAPYPLIVYSHGGGSENTDLSHVMEQLASQGYVVVAPQHHDTSNAYNTVELIDRPLDIMVVINELANITEGDLAGIIDTENIGLMGWSLGATAAFQMLGLISDPVHYQTWCAEEHPELTTSECTDVHLEETIAYRTQLGLQTLSDGTWALFGDARIRSILVFAPCFFPMTNEDSLATVTTPTMILHATKDTGCDYAGNAVRTYRHLGTEDRYLITLVDRGHMVYYNQQLIPQHFATAFFGWHLKADETYAPYLTEEGLPTSSFSGLVWGPYEAE